MSKKTAQIGIIMGSDSDWPIMKEATHILDTLNIPYQAQVVSAHRTPDHMARYGKDAAEKGLKVIIAGAGGAAHLPGMVAAYTTLPVIGVPVDITPLRGLDSLLSIVQMPKGVPVATVAINNAQNAGILAAQIIGTFDQGVAQKLHQFKEDNKEKSLAKKID